MISVRCFESLPEAACLRDDVNALNRRCAPPDPFSTFEFFENYLGQDEALQAGGGLRVWFVTVFRADTLIGYVALKLVSRKTWLRRVATLSFLVTHDNDRPHLVACPENLRDASVAVYGYLLARQREWGFLEFHQQDSTSSLFPPPDAVDLSGYRVSEWPGLPNCTVHLRWSSLPEYMRAMEARFRSNLERQVRHLLAAGELELLSSSDTAATPALLELYRSIEPRSWKSRTDVGIGQEPRRIAYFEGLLGTHQPMRLSIQILLLDGVPIAGLINGSFANGLYALQMVYDEAFGRMSPGSAMLLLGMRQAIDGGYAFFNLLSGFGYYKARWLAQATDTRIAQIYRVGSLWYWHRKIGDWKRAALPALAKPTRALFNPLRRSASRRKLAQAEPGRPTVIAMQPAQRQRLAALIASVRQSPGEGLSAQALASVLQIANTASRARSAHAL
ncbi:MAG TPA: GNAT family N-acetyltransferase [Burkholderiaceae bacterium]